MKIKWEQYGKLFSLLLVMLVSLRMQASADNVRFEKIAADSGLSQQSILSIYQDSKGYLWFGTQEGLNKYDGIKFTSYQPKYNDPHSISSGWIRSITEDAEGNLWVGTRNGLNILDVDTNKFTKYSAGEDENSINDRDALAVYRSSNNTMWVGTQKGLNKYSNIENRFKQYNFYGDENNKNIIIFEIAEDVSGALWLAAGNHGLIRFEPETESIEFISKNPTTPLGKNKISASSVYVDEDQVLWIGSFKNRIYKLDLKTPKKSSVSSSIVHVDDFSGTTVTFLAQDKYKTLWAATTSGLYYKQHKDIRFTLVDKRVNGDSDLSSDEIHSLYSDSSGVFWVGTFTGLYKWNTKTTQFEHFAASGADQSLSSSQIKAIGSDENFTYICTLKGVDLVDKVTGEYTVLEVESNNSPGLRKSIVMSFAAVSEEEVWFGYRDKGATKYNPSTNTFTHYSADKKNKFALGSNGITSILPTSDGGVWFSTYAGGLSRYNRNTDDFTTYWHDPSDISTISSNVLMSIHESKDGNLWLSTWDSGLNVFVPSTGTAFRIAHNKDDPESLGADQVLTVLEDSDSNIWIGTVGGGLNILNVDRREKGQIVFDKLDTENGMPSNVVYGLLEDEQKNVWASTNKGLVKIDMQTKDISLFVVSQGIQGNEFTSGTHHKDKEGRLHFGGPNGVTRFDPVNIKPNLVAPRIVFTGFQQLNKVSSIANVLNENGEIEISHTDYLIGFEFAALDFASPKDNEYMYKLNGFDKDWIEVRGSKRATYTNLPSGKYVFRVKAANSEGVWNEEGESITLVVNPAPWYSWWAYAIYSFLLVIVMLYIVRYYQRRSFARKQYQIELEKEVSIRTSELQEANEQLLHASITDQLTGLHNRRYLADVIEQHIEDINLLFSQAILDERMDDGAGPRLMALMFDLDGFKPINDNYGHDAGDKVIVQVGALLKNECRDHDIVIRWGGDEYMVVAIVEDLDEAKAFAERVRHSISSHAFDVGLSNKFNLSSSLGFALYPFSHFAPHSITWDQVHLLADHALYKSKAAGRNTWTGIVQSDKELPFSVLNSLVPMVDKAIEQQDIRLVMREQRK